MGFRRTLWSAFFTRPVLSSNYANSALRAPCRLQHSPSTIRCYSDEGKGSQTTSEVPDATKEAPAAAQEAPVDSSDPTTEEPSQTPPSDRLLPSLGIDAVFGSAMMGAEKPPPKRSDLVQSPAYHARLPTNIGSRATWDRAIPPLYSPSTEIPRTGPTAGRTVKVTSDLPTALGRLKSILAQNRVRVDQRESKFHVSPGLKRKRLKSLRHRKRFKTGFKRLVEIAMDMKRKGI